MKKVRKGSLEAKLLEAQAALEVAQADLEAEAQRIESELSELLTKERKLIAECAALRGRISQAEEAACKAEGWTKAKAKKRIMHAAGAVNGDEGALLVPGHDLLKEALLTVTRWIQSKDPAVRALREELGGRNAAHNTISQDRRVLRRQWDVINRVVSLHTESVRELSRKIEARQESVPVGTPTAEGKEALARQKEARAFLREVTSEVTRFSQRSSPVIPKTALKKLGLI